jgi:DNA-binding helix-hairpin-helix protein with protein kinase domain
MTEFFTNTGIRISLGNKIGTGGEGSVFEVPCLGSDIVAKVYHELVPADRQAKLHAMVSGCHDSLKKISAWPVATLHLAASEPVRGFLMPRMVECEPLHHIYSPSHRKQRFPEKDWAFLVHTARNVSAAFEAIHGHGHVIGDVNPNLVFVAGNSLVKLIDCDSFQIAAGGKDYLCEVGVPHFTPPELQTRSSFRGLRRTKNHDNFGLAVLLFHILMMGRHPYSGVFSGASDMPLEKSIEQFRYAFGVNASAKSMSPPPNSVTPKILPTLVAELFERAFTERGASTDGRPSAREWVIALESLIKQLRTCSQESVHKFFNGLPACPWCDQEESFGNCFFISLSSDNANGSFNLAQVWARILSIPPPGPPPEISATSFQVQPTPLPQSVRNAKNAFVYKIIISLILFAGSLIVAPASFPVALIAIFFILISGTNDSSERMLRQAKVNEAQRNMNTAMARWNFEAGNGMFLAKLKELDDLRREYESLAKQIDEEKLKLQNNRRATQLHKFLDKFFLNEYVIPGVGPTRKATLASFGIETAADVDPKRIMKVRGFGQGLTRELVTWRKSLEGRFIFDPTIAVDASDIAAIHKRFSLKRRHIEGFLLAGSESLIQVKEQSLLQRSRMLPSVEAAAQLVAQANADLKALG